LQETKKIIKFIVLIFPRSTAAKVTPIAKTIALDRFEILVILKLQHTEILYVI